MTQFKELLIALADQKVDFIIVGGVAASLHGSPRFTSDLDIVYNRSLENYTKLIKALTPFSPYLRGAPPDLPFKFDSRTLQAGVNFTLQTTVGAIDLLGEIIGGGDFQALSEFTIGVKLFEQTFNCLQLTKLIEVKKAVGRPKDFEAIAELEAIQEELEHDDDSKV